MCATVLPVTSADSARKPTGAGTPADALGETKRMHTSDAESKESCECPTCEDSFDTTRGMKIHHVSVHGESIAGELYTCEQCGTTFRRDPAKARQSDRLFCSLECSSTWQSENWVGEKHPGFNSGLVSCEQCGEQFYRKPSKQAENERTFCSLECWSHCQRVEGNGKVHYGKNWAQQRGQARERDNHTCQTCGYTPSEGERALDVHHIRPVRTFETPKEAHKLENLLTLCRPCHRKWEGIPLRPEAVDL